VLPGPPSQRWRTLVGPQPGLGASCPTCLENIRGPRAGLPKPEHTGRVRTARRPGTRQGIS